MTPNAHEAQVTDLMWLHQPKMWEYIEVDPVRALAATKEISIAAQPPFFEPWIKT